MNPTRKFLPIATARCLSPPPSYNAVRGSRVTFSAERIGPALGRHVPSPAGHSWAALLPKQHGDGDQGSGGDHAGGGHNSSSTSRGRFLLLAVFVATSTRTVFFGPLNDIFVPGLAIIRQDLFCWPANCGRSYPKNVDLWRRVSCGSGLELCLSAPRRA